jgi:hypothetical protein
MADFLFPPEMVEKARRYLAQNGSRANIPLEGDVFDALVVVGCHQFERGNCDFQRWSAAMTAVVGKLPDKILGMVFSGICSDRAALSAVISRFMALRDQPASGSVLGPSQPKSGAAKKIALIEEKMRDKATPKWMIPRLEGMLKELGVAPKSEESQREMTRTPDGPSAKPPAVAAGKTRTIDLWTPNGIIKMQVPEAEYVRATEANRPGAEVDAGSKLQQPRGTERVSEQPSSVRAQAEFSRKMLEMGQELAAKRKEEAIAPLDRLLAELHSQIGLVAVKKDVQELANSIRVDRVRRAQGLRVADRSLHMVFYGNPGTGKTTVARMVAQIYKELGVLEKGHLVCTDRAGLVANYVGQTASKVETVVQEAIGGVLFIDEAYSLAPPNSQNDFGQEAIQQLLLLMENHRKELVVIVAGYPEEMGRFLEANPGLKSRFTKKLHFEDFSPGDLVKIFEKFCTDNDYRLHERARDKLLRSMQTAYSRRDKTFGNARFARNLFEEATKNLANRVVSSSLSNCSVLEVITEDDISDCIVSTEQLSSTARRFPDLGKYLASKGMPPKTALIYTSWEIDDLAVVGRGRYCTTRVQPMDGNEYCVTFDFGGDILEQILMRAPTATQALIRRSLAEDPARVRHLPIPNPINLGIAAILGDSQQCLDEAFIPLIITTVFGDDLTATLEALGIDPSEESLAAIEPVNTDSSSDGIKHSFNCSTLLDPEINLADVEAIRVFCRHLAKNWWKAEPRQAAVCDACNTYVLREEGFLTESNLRCEACFNRLSEPHAMLANLRIDADYYGEGLLDQARRFVGIRPRKRRD